MSSSKFVVDAETAAADFERFCEYARFDWDKPRDENDSRDLELQKKQIEYFIKIGQVTVDEEGHPVIRILHSDLPNGPEGIKFFRKPVGQLTGAADRMKGTHRTAQLNAMMHEATGLPTMLFSKLDGPDWDAAQLVFSFFLP